MPIDISAQNVPKTFCFSKYGAFNRFTDLECTNNGTYKRKLQCCKFSKGDFTDCNDSLELCNDSDDIYDNKGSPLNDDQRAFYDLKKTDQVLHCECSDKVGIISDWKEITGDKKTNDATYKDLKAKLTTGQQRPYCFGDDRSKDNKSRYQFSCPKKDGKFVDDTFYVRSMDKCCTMTIPKQLETSTLSSEQLIGLKCDNSIDDCNGANIISFVKNNDTEMYNKSDSKFLYDNLLCDNDCVKADNRKNEQQI